MKGEIGVDEGKKRLWIRRWFGRPERRARGIGFMLLVHKFPMNGARMNRRPPFRALTYPVSSRFFFPPSSAAAFLSSICLPASHRWPVDLDPPLCEISARLFTAVSLGARVTREEISEFIDPRCRWKPGSVALSISSDVLKGEKAGHDGGRCPYKSWHRRYTLHPSGDTARYGVIICLAGDPRRIRRSRVGRQHPRHVRGTWWMMERTSGTWGEDSVNCEWACSRGCDRAPDGATSSRRGP